MKVTILKEEGHELALMGLAYSYKDQSEPMQTFWTPAKYQRMQELSKSLCNRGAGHNKFLRQIIIWVDVVAPRYWWSEFDTYKIGTVAQSESTMHKLAKREPVHADFSVTTPPFMVEAFKTAWNYNRQDIRLLKASLPEGYLQRRLVTMNYENLRSMIQQREDHRLQEWRDFIAFMRAQVERPELLP